jgi:hypothetical protein
VQVRVGTRPADLTRPCGPAGPGREHDDDQRAEQPHYHGLHHRRPRTRQHRAAQHPQCPQRGKTGRHCAADRGDAAHQRETTMSGAARRESSHGGTAPTRNGARCHVVIGSHAARSTHSTATTTRRARDPATPVLPAHSPRCPAGCPPRRGTPPAPRPRPGRGMGSPAHAPPRPPSELSRRHPSRRAPSPPRPGRTRCHAQWWPPRRGRTFTQLGAERAPGPPQHLDDRRAHQVNPTDATTPAPRHPRLRLMSSTLPDRCPTDPEERARLRGSRRWPR